MTKLDGIILNGTTYDLGGSGDGLSDDAKDAIMDAFNHVAWDEDDPNGVTWINALYTAIYNKTVASLTATFNAGGATIVAGSSVNSLKPYLTVTATYTDSTSEVLDSSAYNLSGTIRVGTNTITVEYIGATATFTVTAIGGSDITPSLGSPAGAYTGTEYSYNSSTDALNVYTSSNGTYRGLRYNPITVEAGYTYQIVFDLEYVSGDPYVAFRASNYTFYGASETINASGHYEFSVVLSDLIAAGTSLYPVIMVTRDTSKAGNVTYKNFRMYKYQVED